MDVVNVEQNFKLRYLNFPLLNMNALSKIFKLSTIKYEWFGKTKLGHDHDLLLMRSFLRFYFFKSDNDKLSTYSSKLP